MRNIIAVCIDDLRKDVCFTTKHRSAPNIYKFAEQGVCFANAFTTSTWSPQAAYSFLTGVDPIHTPYAVVSENEQTVRRQRCAHTSGGGTHFTVGVSANCWVSSMYGFDTLFDRWYDNRRTPLEQALQLLEDGLPEPWLLYLQLMGVHDRRTKKKYEGDEGTAHNFERYRQSVYELDERIGKLLFGKWREEAVLCVFSDHGEYFPSIDPYDVSRWGHGHSLCPTLLSVPFVVCAPGLEVDRNCRIVSLRHLLPILLSVSKEGDYNQRERVEAFVAKDSFAKRVVFDEGVRDAGYYVEYDLHGMVEKRFHLMLES